MPFFAERRLSTVKPVYTMYLSNPYEYDCTVVSIYGNLLVDPVTELADSSEHCILFAQLNKATIPN